ncbi:hypothetical protein SDJN02_12381 [Cucurbita argyrosperma subsp. argyrosperma]|nr:hypothetical protein SDJN02_12381 [Cucurbita argyrosperma subsp. argyrosperma]
MLHVNGRRKLLFSEQWWISAPTRGRRELKQVVEALIAQAYFSLKLIFPSEKFHLFSGYEEREPMEPVYL